MRVFLTAAFVLGLAAPAMADLTLQCDFPDNAGNSVTRGPVVLHHVTGAATAVVNSDIIGGYIGKPIDARVLKEGPGQLVLSWEVKMKNADNQYTRMKYTLNVLNEGAKATYRARPLGYDNDFSNEGKCSKVKVKK